MRESEKAVSKATWIVQSNLGNEEEKEKIKKACRRWGHEYKEVLAIPFSEEVPDIGDVDIPIFYGSTKFIENLSKDERYEKFIFASKNKWKDFSCYAYLENYGNFFLNHKARMKPIRSWLKLWSLESFRPGEHQDLDEVFIRPTQDNKRFNGQLVQVREARRILQNAVDNNWMNDADSVLVANPRNIQREWRLFMRDYTNENNSEEYDFGFCSFALSQYRENGRLKKDQGAPEAVVDFARVMANHWSPAPIFSLDVCESNGKLYVMECGSFHSSGFYDCDIEMFVHEVSDLYLEKFGED